LGVFKNLDKQLTVLIRKFALQSLSVTFIFAKAWKGKGEQQWKPKTVKIQILRIRIEFSVYNDKLRGL
jgi:hypothetical protein